MALRMIATFIMVLSFSALAEVHYNKDTNSFMPEEALDFESHSHQKAIHDFLPPNDLKIPVWSRETNGMTERRFNEIIDSATEIYQPIIESLGGTLTVNKRWTDDTVNASAQQWGNSYIINMYGGLARHPAITDDGFLMVVCHELGHHLAGAPKIGGWWNAWASNEGQSDYFAGLKCLRRVFREQDNEDRISLMEIEIPEYATEQCTAAFPEQEEKIAICERSAMAGMSGATLFQILRKEDVAPQFDTPTDAVVDQTDHRHPATQCRLDTYFQGALCDVVVGDGLEDGLSDTDVTIGTCNRKDGYTLGIRPLCWYKPPQ